MLDPRINDTHFPFALIISTQNERRIPETSARNAHGETINPHTTLPIKARALLGEFKRGQRLRNVGATERHQQAFGVRKGAAALLPPTGAGISVKVH